MEIAVAPRLRRAAVAPALSPSLLAPLWLSTVLGLLPAPCPAARQHEECTAAVIAPAGSATGGPVLWKNRDTDNLSNKVVFVDDRPYAYLGLVNAGNPSGRACWAGLNAAGFGIINTVAYNLPEQEGELKDLEGIIMADALRTCRTVGDFAALVAARLGPELGGLTTFGVIDGEGGAMLFEVHNHGAAQIEPAAQPDGRLVVTNWARTGKENQGAGYLRFERASALFAALPPGPVDFRTILTRFTRDTGHVLFAQPTPFELRELPAGRPRWVDTRDCIDRPATAAAVVLVGRRPGVPHSVATMWVVPGEPVTAVAVPLWVEAGASPEALWRGEEAPLWVESLRIKRLGRPGEEGNKGNYLDLAVLDNAGGTGYLPGLLAVEGEIVAETEAFLRSPREPREYREFQEGAARRALATMELVGGR